MRKLIALALLIFGLVPSTGGAFAQSGSGTVSDFLTQYDSADAKGRQVLEMFIAGQERGLLTANQYLQVVKSKNALYCPPDDAALTPPQLVDAVRKLTASDGRAAAIPLAVAILMVLQRSYPCKEQPSSGH